MNRLIRTAKANPNKLKNFHNLRRLSPGEIIIYDLPTVAAKGPGKNLKLIAKSSRSVGFEPTPAERN